MFLGRASSIFSILSASTTQVREQPSLGQGDFLLAAPDEAMVPPARKMRKILDRAGENRLQQSPGRAVLNLIPIQQSLPDWATNPECHP